MQGMSYAIADMSAPILLTLPSATAASSAFTKLRRKGTARINALLVLSISSYTLAYILSPAKGGRHPYLLWTSLLAGISYGTGAFFEWSDAQQAAQQQSGAGKDGQKIRMSDDEDYVDATHSSANIMTPTSGSEAGEEEGKSVNGEQVRLSIERFGFVERVKRSITFTAFFMGVVGIWGDGVGMSRQ